MSEPDELLEVGIGWCSPSKAREACERWHYTHSMPGGRVAPFGVWEGGRWIGAVIFAPGANYHAGWQFGCAEGQYAELVRVALREHQVQVSHVVPRCIRMLRDHAPGLRLLLSYADPVQGHVGRIYQAMNWTYLGRADATAQWLAPDGRLYHNRAVTGHSYAGRKNAAPPGSVRVRVEGKHKYALGLTRPMARQLAKLAKPYPRGGSVEGDAPDLRSGEAGSIPAHRSTEVPA